MNWFRFPKLLRVPRSAMCPTNLFHQQQKNEKTGKGDSTCYLFEFTFQNYPNWDQRVLGLLIQKKKKAAYIVMIMSSNCCRTPSRQDLHPSVVQKLQNQFGFHFHQGSERPNSIECFSILESPAPSRPWVLRGVHREEATKSEEACWGTIPTSPQSSKLAF